MTAIFLCSLATEVTKRVQAVLQSARASAGTRTLLQGTGLRESTPDCMAPGLLLSGFRRAHFQTPLSPESGQQLPCVLPCHQRTGTRQESCNSQVRGGQTLPVKAKKPVSQVFNNSAVAERKEPQARWMNSRLCSNKALLTDAEMWTSCHFHRSQILFFWLFQLFKKKYKNHSLRVRCAERQCVFLAYRP